MDQHRSVGHALSHTGLFCKGAGVTTTLLRLKVLSTHHMLLPAHSITLHCLRQLQLLKSHPIFKMYFKCHLFHQIFHVLPPLPATAGCELSLFFFDICSLPHIIMIRRQYNIMVKRFGLWNQRSQESSPSWVSLSKLLTSVSSSIKCLSQKVVIIFK